MSDSRVSSAIQLARQIEDSARPNPISLCEKFGINVITDKPLKGDGYLVCDGGFKMIFSSSRITNAHRQKFVISHELGHFLMHGKKLFYCNNISDINSQNVNTTQEEAEANDFASELLLPHKEMVDFIPVGNISFSDIFQIASHFDVSVTHAAIRAIQNSKSENEILLCYNGQRLKWFESGDKYVYRSMLPNICPIDTENTKDKMDISGVWDNLYTGWVHQEIFRPYGSQTLVLLSGDRL